MTDSPEPPRLKLLLPLLVLALVSCRKGSELSNFAGSVPITPTVFGNHGCNAPNVTIQAPTLVFSNAGDGAVFGVDSQIAAPALSDTIVYTGSDGSVHELDFSGGLPPVDTVRVAGGVFSARLALIGIATPARLSGIAVLDTLSYLVVEHTSNSIWLVDRTGTDVISLFAGLPNETPGFSPLTGAGTGAQVRFNFSEPTTLTPTLDGTIYVADTGNHAVRRIIAGVLPATQTITGLGSPAFMDGELVIAGLDNPVAMNIGCDGRFLLTELGGNGMGLGNRLRSAGVGGQNFFGGFNGDILTVAGDGNSASTSTSLAAPRGIASSEGGEVYLVDSATGILRRTDVMTGVSDCPPFVDCASAVAPFTPGGHFALAITQAVNPGPGRLYVLDADAGELLRVTP